MQIAALALTFLSLIAAPAQPASSRYGALAPYELALKADLIVDGTITQFDHARIWQWDEGSDTAVFTVRIDEVIAGEFTKKRLEIRQFANWPCAQRYAPYEKGQRAVFHVRLDRRPDGSLALDRPAVILSLGNEGECPITEGKVLVKAHWEHFEALPREAFGHKYFPCPAVPKREYFEAVRGVRRAFRWPSSQIEERLVFDRNGPVQDCSDAELAQLADSSEAAEAMIEETQSRCP